MGSRWNRRCVPLLALLLLAFVATSASAGNPFPACADGIDNDGDGLVDHPADPGCQLATSDNESPSCDDGLDNDGDGLVDYPQDPGCFEQNRNMESTLR